ncbi:MAG: Ig-like domain-containing protein [Candidatus Cloacimonadales bacterium]|nr:Ig-like domain-containing protein [Candidatus Cloacimonadales bacterium]
MKMRFRELLCLFIFTLILNSCGHRKNPTGGEKDTINPEIISITPDEFSNLAKRNIEVVFSKPIERSTIYSGLYIYPPIQKKKFKWDKNILTIRIMEELEEDTNYFVTFTTRIKCEHGNELDQEYTFIYSSGNLSENRISGRIVFEDPEDSNLPVKCTLMAADSTFILSRKITASTFAFENLNNIEHIIEAYCDKNKNNKYEYGKEPYCYLQIPAEKSISIDLEMTYSDTLNPELKSAKAIWNNQIEIIFSEVVSGLQDLSLHSTDSISKPLQIITQVLKEDRIMILTEPMDSLKYEARIIGLTDKKNNTADTLFIVLNSNVLIDSIPPKIISIEPRNGGTVPTDEPVIKITFSEIILIDNFTAKLIEAESSQKIPLQVISGHSDYFELKPRQKLTNYTTYNISIEVKDQNGNKLPKTNTSSFIVIIR